ncbi:hypothetical protein FEM48_Zijuj10G0141400 [Ziziphus jujuba var. spinosa]|uniref:Uncharacterized protein n=1 Tax=Ziziphus jujuba var. spinosa TaxID=714518 RepID=A0A978UNU6_ZIZJJ|nr:hypothetical protein FEM48_Zijuj10G0141400 [Ziziphus jujuba var. spinosa]
MGNKDLKNNKLTVRSVEPVEKETRHLILNWMAMSQSKASIPFPIAKSKKDQKMLKEQNSVKEDLNLLDNGGEAVSG